MFLLVAFMLMDNMLKFLSVQCILVIPYPQVTEQKLWCLHQAVISPLYLNNNIFIHTKQYR